MSTGNLLRAEEIALRRRMSVEDVRVLIRLRAFDPPPLQIHRNGALLVPEGAVLRPRRKK